MLRFIVWIVISISFLIVINSHCDWQVPSLSVNLLPMMYFAMPCPIKPSNRQMAQFGMAFRLYSLGWRTRCVTDLSQVVDEGILYLSFS